MAEEVRICKISVDVRLFSIYLQKCILYMSLVDNVTLSFSQFQTIVWIRLVEIVESPLLSVIIALCTLCIMFAGCTQLTQRLVPFEFPLYEFIRHAFRLMDIEFGSPEHAHSPAFGIENNQSNSKS